MRLTFLGSGDAFGSGGRLNTCFHVERGARSFLIDCGASAMISIRRFAVAPNDIATIFISHLHGDHFGGLVFFILDAQLISRRTDPLTVVGPPGLADRLTAAMEVLIPGSTRVTRRFEVRIVELEPGVRTTVGDVAVTGFLVTHACGAPPLALRIETDGKVIAYSGDTEWDDNLIAAGRDADLLIAEAYFYDRKIRYHLDYAGLRAKLPEIRPKRLILTHMSAEMLGRADTLGCEIADDGLVVEIA